MLLLYNFTLKTYRLAISAAAPFNRRARAWIQGRRDTGKILEKAHEGNWIMIHCASLGEFEQGRPVIEALRTKYPAYKVLLTFFSPSGYEIRKNYKLADKVMYLPFDTRKNAAQLISSFDLKLVIFVKYEFWYHLLFALKSHSVPAVLISAVFRPGQIFFKPWGGLFRRMLTWYNRIFVQDEASAKLLQDIGVSNITVAGDTRFDRVSAIAGSALPDFPEAFRGHNIMVCGSTWPADEEIILKYFFQHARKTGWKLIIAPHMVDRGNVHRLLKATEGAGCLLSAYQGKDCSILIIDSIGLLSSLYSLADIAYVGGGFGHGIHNILEAAVYGVPVVFGPKYHKFNEAVRLIKEGGAFAINDDKAFEELMQKLTSNADFRQKAGARAAGFVKVNTGATTVIMSKLPGLPA